MKTTTIRDSKRQRTVRFFESLGRLGFTYSEADSLRLIEKTLARWSEKECGDGNDYSSWAIERDETTGKPYLAVYPHNRPSYRTPIADREAGALRRAKAILAAHPGLWMYYQGDPRGCSLYVGRQADVEGMALGSVYTRGIACCID